MKRLLAILDILYTENFYRSLAFAFVGLEIEGDFEKLAKSWRQ